MDQFVIAYWVQTMPVPSSVEYTMNPWPEGFTATASGTRGGTAPRGQPVGLPGRHDLASAVGDGNVVQWDGRFAAIAMRGDEFEEIARFPIIDDRGDVAFAARHSAGTWEKPTTCAVWSESV